MKIETLADLIEYIKRELVEQTQYKRKTCKLELESVMFYKLIKLIQFYLRDNENEPYRNVNATEHTTTIRVRINSILTTIKKK